MPGLDETANEFRWRLQNPDLFIPQSFRRKQISDGVALVVARKKDTNKWEAQALRFDKDKFSRERAMKWIKDHEGSFTELNQKDYDLETVDLKGVEIFSAVNNPNGHKYSDKDLEEMVKGFYETKDELKPYLKLGHDEKQKLAQKSGLPALGWVENLRRKGKKLIADFIKVPKKIYELIKAGAYRRISAEIFWNIPINGKKYNRLLKAVALLGADTPACGDLKDIVSLYSENLDYYNNQEIEVTEYEFEVENNEIIENQMFNCECIECGYIMKTNKHCNTLKCPKCGGQMRRLERPGPGQGGESTMAKWDTKFINDLPDSSFAFIKSGGKKDEEGKTVPRTLRYLPYKDANGKIDLPHLRNALARLPQTNLTPQEKAKARAVLIKAAKQAGVGEYEIEQILKEGDKMTVEELQAKIDFLEKELKKYQEEAEKAKEEKEEVEKKAEEVEKQKEEAEKKLEEKEQEQTKTEVNSLVEKLVEEGHLYPVDKDVVSDIIFNDRISKQEKKYKLGDEEKSLEEVLVSILQKYFVDLNTDENSEVGDTTSKKDNEDLLRKAEKYAKEHNVSYREALIEVSK